MDMKFDDWLEEELRRGARQVHGRLPDAPRYASLPPLGRGPMMHGLGALAKSKVVVAATATLLVAGSGVAAKAAITGDANPFHWGKQVSQQVDKCKNQLGPNENGIGQCVSEFAKQHGQQMREEHSQAGAHSQAGSHSQGGSHSQAGSPPGAQAHGSGQHTHKSPGPPTSHPGVSGGS
jgi:hypothetical protein